MKERVRVDILIVLFFVPKGLSAEFSFGRQLRLYRIVKCFLRNILTYDGARPQEGAFPKRPRLSDNRTLSIGAQSHVSGELLDRGRFCSCYLAVVGAAAFCIPL